MGALPEVMPLCTPRDVTRKRTEPTIVTALPNGEPDRELERPDAEGRVVHSTLDPMQNGTHVHPAKGTAYPCGVLDPRLGKVDTVMGLMALPTVVKKKATPLWDLCAGEHNWAGGQQQHRGTTAKGAIPL